MKKIFSIILLYTFLSSFTPDNPTTESTGAVTVKYEIILSSPLIQLAPTLATPTIIYKMKVFMILIMEVHLGLRQLISLQLDLFQQLYKVQHYT